MLFMVSAMALAATVDCSREDPCRRTPKKGTMHGTASTDEMSGLGGDDGMDGLEGTDLLSGQDGDDTLRGGQGGDELDGYFGNDTFYGGPGNDVMRGDYDWEYPIRNDGND